MESLSGFLVTQGDPAGFGSAVTFPLPSHDLEIYCYLRLQHSCS